MHRALLSAALLGLACPATGQHFLADHQADDGHWAAEASGGAPGADVRVTAWAVLVYLGDGQAGTDAPWRRVPLAGIRWLCGQQDGRGRIGPRPDPEWLLDHAMATFALAEAARVGLTDDLQGAIERAITVLTAELRRASPAPAIESCLWCEMVARSVVALGDRATPSLEERGKVLAALVRTAEPVAAASPRGQAAALLRTALEEPQNVADGGLPEAWPEDVLADPLATFYAAAACFRCGGRTWRTASKRLEAIVKAQQKADGDAGRGGWKAAAGEFGAANGALGTTAVHIVTLEIYYRYCRLSPCQ